MAVQPDRRAGAALDPGTLEAFADAGLAIARGARVGEVLQAVVAAAARAAEADVVVVRVVEPERRELVARAVAAASGALAIELEGTLLPLDDLPLEEVELDSAPEAVRRLADRVGAGWGLVLPLVVSEEVVGSLELLRQHGEFEHDARVAARFAAVQAGLAIWAFGSDTRGERAGADERALRLAGDALAAASDVARTVDHVVRLALEVSGADAALLWRPDSTGALELAATSGGGAAGLAREGAKDSALRALSGYRAHVEQLGRRALAGLPLGEPPVGLLQLAFEADRAPRGEELERLGLFALRAGHALRASERARTLATELEQTRVLLAAVGEANAQLSLPHALDTAIERVAELVGTDRLAIYLREDGRLTPAAERGLAGPHARIAEALLELALGPFRGRGLVELENAAADVRLAPVADALSEAGIESAVALPLVVRDDVTGLLGVYPRSGRVLTANEATLLTALAGQLAVAVQNARLHEQATRLGSELELALAAERAAAKRLRALYEISRSFAQELSLEATLNALTRTVVELLGVDAAVLRMPDPRREQLLPLAIHVADERMEEAVRSMLFRPQRLSGAAIQRLFRLGEPVVLDVETATKLGGSHTLFVPFLEKGSTAAIVPIATSAEVLGSLTLLSVRPDRPIGSGTIDLAVDIGGQAALAIVSARLYQQQKDFADAMQRSLLPQVRPPVTGLELGEVYAWSERVELGGDFYDYFALADGRLAVVLGDVTGHGIEAAADMAMAKFVFRSLSREHPQPADFLVAANEVVVGEIAPGKFITMAYVLIDPQTGELGCACAGHPEPRLVAADGSVRPIPARGLALGVEQGIEFEERRERLEPGDGVVLFTDGVIEARRSGELYGTERLDALLARRHALSPEDIAASVIDSARRFTGGELLDDCAVVVLKRTL